MFILSKYLRSLVSLAALCLVSCSQQKPITNGAWSFDVNKGKLTCYGKPVPASLAQHQLWLFTPLGTFAPRADGTWLCNVFRLSLPDSTKPWVQLRINSTSSRMMEHTKAGFYATHTLGWGPSSWLDCQLTDTPPSWIYAFRVRDEKERGAWLSPEKLGEVDWEEILEKRETAQLRQETGKVKL